GDAALVVRLVFLCRVIFGVLRKIAVRARLRDVLDDAGTLHRLAMLQLVGQSGMARGSHRNLFDHLLCPSIARAPLKHARDTWQIRPWGSQSDALRPIDPTPFGRAVSTIIRAVSSKSLSAE